MSARTHWKVFDPSPSRQKSYYWLVSGVDLAGCEKSEAEFEAKKEKGDELTIYDHDRADVSREEVMIDCWKRFSMNFWSRTISISAETGGTFVIQTKQGIASRELCFGRDHSYTRYSARVKSQKNDEIASEIEMSLVYEHSRLRSLRHWCRMYHEANLTVTVRTVPHMRTCLMSLTGKKCLILRVQSCHHEDAMVFREESTERTAARLKREKFGRICIV